MARPTKADNALKSKIDQLREKTVEKFFGLSDKMLKHIEWSMAAQVPCTSCSVSEDGVHRPGKAKDEGGKCAQCHGTYLVPDKVQRNWATEQAQPIVAPAPKTVEMSVEQTSSVPELESEVKKLSDEEITKRLEVLKFESLG